MTTRSIAIPVLLVVLALNSSAWAGNPFAYRAIARRQAALDPRNGTVVEKTVNDPTRYDCRTVVAYEQLCPPGSKSIHRRVIRECPHEDKLAAGECETHWLFGMRCAS
jgi:hypothetical protein